MNMDTVILNQADSCETSSTDLNDQFDINQLCRLCAINNDLLIPIFQQEGLEHDLKSKISRHLPIKVKESDKLPTQLCYQCASTVVAWHDLVVGCLEADKKLRSLIEDVPKHNEGDESVGSHCTNDLFVESGNNIEVEHITDSDEIQFQTNAENIATPMDVSDNTITGLIMLKSSKTKEVSSVSKSGEPESIKDSFKNLALMLKATQSNSNNSFFCLICGSFQMNLSILISHMSLKHQVHCKNDLVLHSIKSVHYKKILSQCLSSAENVIKHANNVCSENISSLCSTNSNTRIIKYYNDCKKQISNLNREIDTNHVKTVPASYISQLELLRNTEGRSLLNKKNISSDKKCFETQLLLNNVGRNCGNSLHTSNANIFKDTSGCKLVNPSVCDVKSKEKQEMISQKVIIKGQVDGKCKHAFLINDKSFKTKEKVNEKTSNIVGTTDTTRSSTVQITYPYSRESTRLNKKIKAHKKPVKCSHCDSSHTHHRALKAHVFRKHRGEKIDGPQRSMDQLDPEVAIMEENVNGVQNVRCKICSKIMPKKKFIRHQRIHSGERPYVCHVCGKQFRMGADLDSHFRKVHRKMVCKVCYKGFNTTEDLAAHRTTHTTEKTFMCDICGKSFHKYNSLYCHIKLQHTKDNYNHHCTYCDKKFQTKQRLINHVRSHTGERPYPCSDCSKRFKTGSILNNHRKHVHLKEKKNICPVCGKAFVGRYYMSVHMKKIHFTAKNNVANTDN